MFPDDAKECKAFLWHETCMVGNSGIDPKIAANQGGDTSKGCGRQF